MLITAPSYAAYKKTHTAQADYQFDLIIIGSGTGGLSSASFLAQAGKRVLLLEQHYSIGGYTHAFQRNGYMWDVGLHYVGQVHLAGTTQRSVFDYITQGKLQWAPLDDIYDRAVFGDKEYEFPSGKERFRAKLKEYFPADKDHAAIDQYFQLLDEVANLGAGYYVEKALPPMLSKLFGGLLRRKLLRYSDQITLDVLHRITDNEELIGVLTAQYGDYGLQPSQSSFYMHAILANHYMDGAGYPVGGASRLAECIVPIIEQAGGVVLSRARVKQIVVEGNTAVGVEMMDGGKFYAKKIVSDAGIVNTYRQLLPEAIVQRHHLDQQLAQLEPSLAHVGLYVGIKEPTAGLNLPKCNYWIFPAEYNHLKSQNNYSKLDDPIPVAFASFPSAKDPESELHTPGRTMAEVIILVPYSWFQQWENTQWHRRDADYTALKAKLAEQLFEQLYRVAPQLKGKVDYYEVSTPVTTKHFAGHPSGEIYGTNHTPKRFRQAFLRPHTPVRNLFLTGQDVVTASIAGGTMGGLLTASAILKKNLLSTVQHAR